MSQSVKRPGLHAAPHREFSANVLMRTGGKKSGIGARVYVKENNLYLDYPDLVNHRRVAFWFLSNGVVASVKEASDEEFNPGPAAPLFIGFVLKFRSTNPDRFCEEFRPHYIALVKATAGELSREDLKVLRGQRLFSASRPARKWWRSEIVEPTNSPVRWPNTGQRSLSTPG